MRIFLFYVIFIELSLTLYNTKSVHHFQNYITTKSSTQTHIFSKKNRRLSSTDVQKCLFRVTLKSKNPMFQKYLSIPNTFKNFPIVNCLNIQNCKIKKNTWFRKLLKYFFLISKLRMFETIQKSKILHNLLIANFLKAFYNVQTCDFTQF